VKIAAVLVSYNSAGHIGRCLDSCLAFQSALAAGIIVVDNASTDATLEEVRCRTAITVLANTANVGFAGAVNQGFAHASGADAVLVLNPDIVLLRSPVELQEELDDPGVGVAAGVLVDASGAQQRGFQVRRFPTPAAFVFENLGINRLWPGNPVNTRYRCLDLDLSHPQDVDQPAGACLLIRRQAWLAAGGMDESFHPVWFEDVDFLRRLTLLGWRVRFTPRFRAEHAGGHSFVGLGWEDRQGYWYANLLTYAVRHFRKLSWGLIGGSIVLGLLPRAVTGMFLQRSSRPLAVYVKVVRLVLTYLWRGCTRVHSDQLVPPPVIEESGPSGS
jgi:N-acetylglucosaminyl-diphospho-decaprenol L-rhamnosyltransferase